MNMIGEMDRVADIKKQIVTNAGQRGANIANLCNQGYLSSHIIPLYDHLVTKFQNQQEFDELYERIVVDHIFVVFVSKIKSELELTQEISEKIAMVKQYGWNKVHIHALSYDNVRIARKAIDRVTAGSKIINDVQIKEDSTHLSATIFIKF